MRHPPIVRDNPESYADLDGHMAFPGECWTGSAACPAGQESSTANNQISQGQAVQGQEDDKIYCTGDKCKLHQTVTVKPQSFWQKLKSLFSFGDTGAASGGVPRVNPRILRGRWERFWGRVWPKTATGRNFDVAHTQALADEGDNSVENIAPMEHTEHMEFHKANGDFIRWGLRARYGDLGDQMYDMQYGQMPPAAAEGEDELGEAFDLDWIP